MCKWIHGWQLDAGRNLSPLLHYYVVCTFFPSQGREIETLNGKLLSLVSISLSLSWSYSMRAHMSRPDSCIGWIHLPWKRAKLGQSACSAPWCAERDFGGGWGNDDDGLSDLEASLSLSLSRQIFCSQAQNKPNYVLRLFECKELKEYPKLMEWLTYEGHAIMCIDPGNCCHFTIASWRQLCIYRIYQNHLFHVQTYLHILHAYGGSTSELIYGGLIIYWKWCNNYCFPCIVQFFDIYSYNFDTQLS